MLGNQLYFQACGRTEGDRNGMMESEADAWFYRNKSYLEDKGEVSERQRGFRVFKGTERTR